LDISIPAFNEWAKNAEMVAPDKGQFILTDALGNQYKTWYVGEALSLEPKITAE